MGGLEEIKDEKTGQIFLIYRNNHGAFLLRELRMDEGTIDVKHGVGGTIVFE